MKILTILPLIFFSLMTQVSCHSQSYEPSLLNKIKSGGILLIGTTGDYAPFSEYKNKSFVGSDIEMAKQLAKDLGVKAQFVKTSWKNLTEDLKKKKFHIALSGITIKPERKKFGFFSAPYVQFGKMGIALCKQAKRFNSLKAIDQKNVRVIVNPGGTNESFTKKHIKKAQIIDFKDNNKIFDQIIKGKADLMITDSVEVKYQSQKHKGILCPTMKKPLTNEEIAIYMQKDDELKSFIEKWLMLVVADRY